MKKRGPKFKFGEKATEQININVTPDMAAQLVEQARAAGYEWQGGTVDFARTILLQALNERKASSTAGAADPYGPKA